MKHKNKIRNLKVRQKQWDEMSRESQSTTKRPGSYKK